MCGWGSTAAARPPTAPAGTSASRCTARRVWRRQHTAGRCSCRRRPQRPWRCRSATSASTPSTDCPSPSGSTSCSFPTCPRSSRRCGRATAGRAAAPDRARRRLRAAARGDRTAARGRGHGDRRAGGRGRRSSSLVEVVSGTGPTPAIVDIRMPPTYTDDGLRAARAIREQFAGVGVLVLSRYLELGYAVRAPARRPRPGGLPAQGPRRRRRGVRRRRPSGRRLRSGARPARSSPELARPAAPSGRSLPDALRTTSASCWS